MHMLNSKSKWILLLLATGTAFSDILLDRSCINEIAILQLQSYGSIKSIQSASSSGKYQILASDVLQMLCSKLIEVSQQWHTF